MKPAPNGLIAARPKIARSISPFDHIVSLPRIVQLVPLLFGAITLIDSTRPAIIAGMIWQNYAAGSCDLIHAPHATFHSFFKRIQPIHSCVLICVLAAQILKMGRKAMNGCVRLPVRRSHASFD